MDLIVILLAAGAGGLGSWWAADAVLNRLGLSTLAAPPAPPLFDEWTLRLPLVLIDPALDRCWLCSPTPDPGRYDGERCPTCRLLGDVFPDQPVPYWPTEGDPR